MAGTEQSPAPVVPPAIIDDIQDQYPMIGESWELKISIGGDVHIKVTVEKDNIQLPQDDRMKILSCNNVVTMSINDVNEEDSGEYKLEVSNDGGSVTCSFNMVVKKYNFRYQNLLVEIGTKVLKNIFDCKVGHDFSKYLAANTNQSRALQLLITPKKKGMKPTLTSEQAKLLPPLDNNPKSSNFDITLLSCLLRNVCGLKSSFDAVWTTPASTDFTEEADITRLRQCRNHLSHNGTVLFPATEFTTKWQELSDLLLRLNNVAGILDLQSDINKAEHTPIDEKLEEKLSNVLKEWTDSDRLLEDKIDKVDSKVDTVKQDLVDVQRKVDHVAQTCQTLKSVKLSAIKDKLVAIYRHHCSTLQVSPLFEDQDEDLLKIYKQPSLHCVPYHKEEKQHKQKEVSTYQDLFSFGDKQCRNIYISGDAGTGKTSLCKRMCLVWCMAKCGDQIGHESCGSKLSSKLKKVRDLLQKDISYMIKFDFLFYVSLRDTSHYNVINMIEEQLLYDFKGKYSLGVDTILTNYKCIVLLDALDEWSPNITGGMSYKLPQRNYSPKCVYITTCRPYKIAHDRLSRTELDMHVQISGIDGGSSSAYVEDIINYMNHENSEHKNLDEFMGEIEACGLKDQLSIPMLSSHLVMLWFDTQLTGLSRATIYANILEILFEQAERRKITAPASSSNKIHLLGCLSKLKHCNKHSSLLYKVCLLSFKALFKQDDNASSLVFTSDQLQEEPIHLSEDEQQYLCRIGVLSKNKVIGCSLKQKIKLSFIHKSYLEFFAAMFTVLSGDIMKWSSLHDLLQFENYIVLLVGFLPQNNEFLFGKIFSMISDDLSLCRRNAIFHYDSYSYQEQFRSLQAMVVKCFKELSRSNVTNSVLKLEDFTFDSKSDVDILRQLLLLNTTCVKSVYSAEGKYYDEFDEIKNLQCLHVGEVLSENVVKFTKCMLSNQSTLHTVCIDGRYSTYPYLLLLPELPVRSLHQLTSLSLCDVTIQHEQLHDLVTFLSDNVHFEHLKLYCVCCDKHRYDDSNCASNLNIQQHSTLRSLSLDHVNISCSYVNTTSLKSVKLGTLSERISNDYINVFNSLKDSQIEHLYIYGYYKLDDKTLRSLTTAVNSLSSLKHLTLRGMKFPSDILLHLHCDTITVKIVLRLVTMSRQCFQCFIESLVNKKSVINVKLHCCTITSVDGEPRRQLSREELWDELWEESVDYMAECLSSIQTVNITYKSDSWLNFETTSCQ